MLLPKRVKYRRVHRGRLKGKALRGNFVAYGDFGIAATEYMDHLQSDRGSPYRDDPLHQAWWSGMDQDLPRQADHREAG